MPLQVKPIPLAIVNFGYSGNPVASIKYFAEKSKVARMIDALHVGVAAGCKPRQLIELLAANHHNPTAARAFFTAVLSVKTPEDASPEVLADIDRRIEQAARDLSQKLGVPVVAWIHKNTKTRHGHLIFPNSDGRRTLPLARKFLKEIQGFGWTAALASGRGKGERKALPVYPKARNLRVRDLAGQLLNPAGQFMPEQLEVLLQTGVFTAPRRRKNGSLISFEVNQQRVRVATLEGFIQQLKGDQTMVTPVTPSLPPPPALQAQLTAAGFDPGALTELLNRFQQTNKIHERARELEAAEHVQQPEITR